MSEFDRQKNKNLRRLCKMARAWKNKHGVGMGGLLVDTLAYNFLKSTDEYDTKSYRAYDVMSRDFFEYLKDQPKQEFYAALGSGQRVKVKKDFRKKAKKAYDLCLEAIEAKGKDIAHDKWKKIYGRPFPSRPAINADTATFSQSSWKNTEEFIEDKFIVDIRYNMSIDCEISQNGFRPHPLSEFLHNKLFRLSTNKSLKFHIKSHDVERDHLIYWKVLNRGEVARKKNIIRGQIFLDKGSRINHETTNFRGEHIVECYAVKDGVVVAKDRIDVPIE